jgi:hypothetical protein
MPVAGREKMPAAPADVSPPATQWSAKEIAIDGWHHMVYAAATATACELLGQTR